MKNKIILLNLYLLFSAVSFSLFAQQSVKVLAIGNSFSADAVEEFLDGLSTEGGTEITVANAFIGGCSLEKHWENSAKAGRNRFTRGFEVVIIKGKEAENP